MWVKHHQITAVFYQSYSMYLKYRGIARLGNTFFGSLNVVRLSILLRNRGVAVL